MAKFEKGNKGKPKGAKNKITKSVKEVVFDAFNLMQGDPKVNIFSWGQSNPTEFYKIAAKLIPNEVKSDITSGGQTLRNWEIIVETKTENK
jgi:hypothetical protein